MSSARLPPPRSASICCCRSRRPRTARGPSARRSRRSSLGVARAALTWPGMTRANRRWPLRELAATDRLLAEDHEIPAILHALDGRFIRPAPAATCCARRRSCRPGAICTASTPSASRAPSLSQMAPARRSASSPAIWRTATRCRKPSRIVLWGTDNLKNEGGPIGQALALMGARPRFDSYGRLAGATLIPLDELGRPRIDVITRCPASSATCCRFRSSCWPKPPSWPPAPTSRSS